MPAISFYAMVNVDHKNQCRNSEVQLRKRRKGKRKQQSPRLSICFISPSLPIHTRFKALESIRIMPFPPMIRKYSFSGQETEFELQMWRSSKLGRTHCCLSISHSFILPLSKQKDDFKILGIHASSPNSGEAIVTPLSVWAYLSTEQREYWVTLATAFHPG